MRHCLRILCLAVSVEHRLVTDRRQTDTRRQLITRASWRRAVKIISVILLVVICYYCRRLFVAAYIVVCLPVLPVLHLGQMLHVTKKDVVMVHVYRRRLPFHRRLLLLSVR